MCLHLNILGMEFISKASQTLKQLWRIARLSIILWLINVDLKKVILFCLADLLVQGQQLL